MRQYLELPATVSAIQFNDWTDDTDVVITHKDKFGILYPNTFLLMSMVEAVRYTQVYALEDKEGLLEEIELGDYIVTYKNGNKRVVKQNVFEAQFKEVADAEL